MSVDNLTAATQFIQDTDLILSKVNLILDESSKLKTNFSDLNHILDSITKYLIIKLDNLENDATRLRRDELSRIRSQLTTFNTQSLRVWDQLSKEMDYCRRGEAMNTLDKFSSLINQAKVQKIQNTTLLEEALIMQSNCELFTKRCLQEFDQFHSILNELSNQSTIELTVMNTLLDIIKDLQENSKLLPIPELLPILLQRYSDIIQVRYACCHTLKKYTPLIETIEQDVQDMTATVTKDMVPLSSYEKNNNTTTTNNNSNHFSFKLHKLQKEKLIFTDHFFENIALINNQLLLSSTWDSNSDTTATSITVITEASMKLSSHISTIDNLVQDSKSLFEDFYHKAKILEFFIKRSSIEEAEDLLQTIYNNGGINSAIWTSAIYQAIEDAIRAVRAYTKDFNNFEILWNKSIDECSNMILQNQITITSRGDDDVIISNNMEIIDASDISNTEDGGLIVFTENGAQTSSSLTQQLVISDDSHHKTDNEKIQEDDTMTTAATSDSIVISMAENNIDILDDVPESDDMHCDPASLSASSSVAPSDDAASQGETPDPSSKTITDHTGKGEQGVGGGAEIEATPSTSNSLTSSNDGAIVPQYTKDTTVNESAASEVSTKIIVTSRSSGKKTKTPLIEKEINASGHRHHTRGKKLKNTIIDDSFSETLNNEDKTTESSLVTPRASLPIDKLTKIITSADTIWLPRCSDFEDQLVDFRMKESSLLLSTPKISSQISLLYALCFACREAISTVRKVYLLATATTTTTSSVNNSIQKEKTEKMTRKQLKCSISNISNIIEKGQYDHPILSEACNSLTLIDNIAEQWETTAHTVIKMRTKRVVSRRGRTPTTIPETTRRQVTYQDLKLILNDPITKIIQYNEVLDVQLFANEMESWITQTNDMLLRKRRLTADPHHDNISNIKKKIIEKKLDYSISTNESIVLTPLHPKNDLRSLTCITTSSHKSSSEEYHGDTKKSNHQNSGSSSSSDSYINFEIGDNTSEIEMNNSPPILNEKQPFNVDNNDNYSGSSSKATTDSLNNAIVEVIENLLNEIIINFIREEDNGRESKERSHTSSYPDITVDSINNIQLASSPTHQTTHSNEMKKSGSGELLLLEEDLNSSSSNNSSKNLTTDSYKKTDFKGVVAGGTFDSSMTSTRSTTSPISGEESPAALATSIMSSIVEINSIRNEALVSGTTSVSMLDLTKEEGTRKEQGNDQLNTYSPFWLGGSSTNDTSSNTKVGEKNREQNNNQFNKLIYKFNRKKVVGDPVVGDTGRSDGGGDAMIIDLTGDDDDDENEDHMMIVDEVEEGVVIVDDDDGDGRTKTNTNQNTILLEDSTTITTILPRLTLPSSSSSLIVTTKYDSNLAHDEDELTTSITSTTSMVMPNIEYHQLETYDNSNTDDATSINKEIIITDHQESNIVHSHTIPQEEPSIECTADAIIQSLNRRVGNDFEESYREGEIPMASIDNELLSSSNSLNNNNRSTTINEGCLEENNNTLKGMLNVNNHDNDIIITQRISSDLLNHPHKPLVVVTTDTISLEASNNHQVTTHSEVTDNLYECTHENDYIDDSDVILYDEVFKMYDIMEKLLSYGLQEDYNILKWAQDVYAFVLDVPRILDPDIEEEDINLNNHKILPLNQATKLLDTAWALADIRPFIRSRLELLEVIEKPLASPPPPPTATTTTVDNSTSSSSSSLLLEDIDLTSPRLVFTIKSHYGLRCFQKICHRLSNWSKNRMKWEKDVHAFNTMTTLHSPEVQQEYERLIYEYENLRISPDPAIICILENTLYASKRALKKQLRAESDLLSKTEHMKKSAANNHIDEEIMDNEVDAGAVITNDKNSKKSRPKRKQADASSTTSNSTTTTTTTTTTTNQDNILPATASTGNTSKRRKVGGSSTSHNNVQEEVEEAHLPFEDLPLVPPSRVPVPPVTVGNLLETIFPDISNSNSSGKTSQQKKEKEGSKKKCHNKSCKELVTVSSTQSGVYCSDHCLSLAIPELLRLMINYRNYLRTQGTSLLSIPEEMKLFEADLAAAYRPSVSSSEDSLDFDDTLYLFESSNIIETTSTTNTNTTMTTMTTHDITKESVNKMELSNVSNMSVESESTAGVDTHTTTTTTTTEPLPPSVLHASSSSDTLQCEDDIFHSLFLHFDNEGNVDNTVDVRTSSTDIGSVGGDNFGGKDQVVNMEVDSRNNPTNTTPSDGVTAHYIGWSSTVNLADRSIQTNIPNWSSVYEMLPSLPLSAAAVLCPYGQSSTQEKVSLAPPPLQRVSSLEDSKPPGTMIHAVTRQLLQSTMTTTTSHSDASSKLELRVQVQQMLEDHLVASFLRQQFTSALTKAAILAEEIEDVMYKNYSSLNSVESRKEYRKKFLMLKRNLKHAHNDPLMFQLYDNKLSILKLLSMSPNELADPVTQEIRAEQQKNAFLEAKNAQSLNETIENRRRLAMAGNEELWRNKDSDLIATTTTSLPIFITTTNDDGGGSGSSNTILTLPETIPSTPTASQSNSNTSISKDNLNTSVTAATQSTRKRPLHPDASGRLSSSATQPLSQSARSHAVRQKIAREMAESELREQEADTAEAVVTRPAKDSSKRTKSPTVQELIEITNNAGPPPMIAPPYSRAPLSTMTYFVSPDIANSTVPLTLLNDEGGDEFVIRHPAFSDLHCHAITVDVRLSGLYPPVIVIKGRSRVEVIEEFFREQCGPGKTFWYPVPFLLHVKSSPENDEAYRFFSLSSIPLLHYCSRCCLEFSSMRKIGLCHPYGGRTKQIYIVPPALKSEISVLRNWTIPTLSFPLTPSELILYGVALFQPPDPYALIPPPPNPVLISTATPSVSIHNSSQQPVRSILKQSHPPQSIETSSNQPTRQSYTQAAPATENMKGSVSDAHPALKVYPQKPQQQPLKSALKQSSSHIPQPIITSDTSSNKLPLLKPANNLGSADISNLSINIKDNNVDRNLAITSVSNLAVKKDTNIATTRSIDDDKMTVGKKVAAASEYVNNNNSNESTKNTINKPKVNIFDEVHDDQMQNRDSINYEMASSKIDTNPMNTVSKEHNELSSTITTTTINMADLIKAAEFIAKHGDIVLPVIQEKPGSRDRVPFIFEGHPGYQQFIDKVKELRMAQSDHVEITEAISSTISATKIQTQSETINKSSVAENNANQGGVTSSSRSSGRTGNFRILPKRSGVPKSESNHIEEEK